MQVSTEIVPECIKYTEKPETPFAGKRRRRTVALYPTQSGPITSAQSNRVVKMRLGNQGFLDPTNTYLSFKAEGSLAGGGGGDTLEFVNYAESFIKRLTVRAQNGSQVIEDIRDYNVWAAGKRRKIAPAYSQSVGRQCLGLIDDSAVRQLRAVEPTKYTVEFAGSGILGGDVKNRKPYLPLKALAGNNSNSIVIEIEFGSVNEVMIATDGAGGPSSGVPSYTISEIVLYQDLVDDIEAEEAIMASLKAGTPLGYHYDTHTHYQNIVQASTSRTTFSLSEFQQSIKGMNTYFRPTADLNSKGEDETAFVNPQLSQYQLQVGSDYFPAQPVLMGDFQNADQYYEMAKNEHIPRRYDDGLKEVVFDGAGESNADNEDFMLGINLRVYDDDCGSQPMADFYSGINTQANPQPLQLNLDLVSNPTAYTADSYVLFDKFLMIEDNKVTIIS